MNKSVAGGDKKIPVSQINLPNGGGAIRGIGETFQANKFTGAANLNIPIPVSPCRDFEPQLTLEYSSGAGNGIFGIGFSLSILSISRNTARAIPKYDDTDLFLLSGSDDLVPVRNSLRSENINSVNYSILTYRPRTEGFFDRIEKWTDLSNNSVHWCVTSKDNVTSIYGESEESQIADPADTTHVFQWLIERTYDSRGNQIVYEYQAVQGNKYIQKIKYGNYLPNTEPDSDDWHFEIGFEYSPATDEHASTVETGKVPPRPDPFSSYRSGFQIYTSLRCIRISMSHRFESESGGQLFKVNATQFDYLDSATSNNLSLLQTVTHIGYGNGVFKEMPPLAFSWSRFQLIEPSQPTSTEMPDFKPLSLESGSSLPGYVERGAYQIIDLYGEGIPGILYSDSSQILYARPLGNGCYAPFRSPQAFPIDRNLQVEQNTLVDLEANGKLDLVVISPARTGYYESNPNGQWGPYQTFASIPKELYHPQRQMVDVTGDGLLDLLLFEDNEVKAYPSIGKLGYAPPLKQLTESMLPVTANPSAREAILFADIFGDGGHHLVRIRNGSVECWPNLGYGRFGQKVELANAPHFGDDMDAVRLFLADIDGSGTTDLIYAYPDHIDIFQNESGNRFGDPVTIPLPRTWNDLSQINFADVLGNGTSCLVFSSLNQDLSLDHLYYDFTGGGKPYLLISVDNNMGATTQIHYSPSTKFYLADEKAGTPWITRVPFPVQVVEKLETIDHISDTRLVNSYTYHHGYYDPIDREFRGFGRVEEQDAETFDDIPDASDAPTFHVPPVTIKTWYHTGAFTEAGILSLQYAAEYYQGDSQAHHLPDSTLDLQFQNGSPESASEAYRALHGHTLRKEIYGVGKDPYLVTEWNYHIRLDQPKMDLPYAVCFVQPRETISYHYECKPNDPRIGHSMTLEVDPYGNVCKSLDIAYGRRTPVTDPDLTDEDTARQSQLLITYTENMLTNAVVTGAYRLPLPAQTRIFELTGFELEGPAECFGFADAFSFPASAEEMPYEQLADRSTKQKRLIKQVRHLYRPDDMGASQNDDPLTLLPLGRLESLALPGESYELAFSPGLLNKVYQRPKAGGVFEELLPDPGSILEVDKTNGLAADRGGYLSSQTLKNRGIFPSNDTDSNWTSGDKDDHWWVPSGRILLSPNRADKASEEQTYAKQHFYLPHRARDPFYAASLSTESSVTYDAYDLLIQETSDALGNRVTAQNNYRVLKPFLITDPNGNRTAVAFDALGMVVATALMGKESETVGDLLEGFHSDLSLGSLQTFVVNPHDEAAALLGNATTRIVYDLDRYQRTSQPPFAATLARETHISDLVSPQVSKIQISFVYSDGFGRVVQSKVQAEPGEAPARAEIVTPANDDIVPGRLMLDKDGKPVVQMQSTRWVSTGRTVFNNKGQPVKQYEPFFSSTHLYEPEREMTDTGVSSILFYDPVGRVVCTLHPNHTYEKIMFDPWLEETWDVNDTVLINPKDDPDAGDIFNLLPANAYQPTWYEQRKDGRKGADEKSAADKTAAHAATPGVQYFDALARPILTIVDNGKDENGNKQKFSTRVILDIEGNQLQLIDAKERIAMGYDYDMRGKRIHQASMDAGERWMLYDVAGELLYYWDSKDRQFRHAYDQLRRTADYFMREGAEAEKLLGRSIYGETLKRPEDKNLRGRVTQIFDQAGLVTQNAYDFKGNLLNGQRQLVSVYWKPLDWSSNPQPVLENTIYTSSTQYDALNRPISATTPDGSIQYPIFNEANLLDKVEVRRRGDANRTTYLRNIDYNAKGQRTLIAYGNGVTTTYAYDPQTFHLVHLQSKRGKDAVQDLNYTYDPHGNITHIKDGAQQTIFFNGQVISPECDYAYDATYRLLSATGREHIGQVSQPESNWNDGARINLPQPGDGQAMRNYSEQYQYDEAGNFEKLIHKAANGSWTRTYTYNEPSPIEPARKSNRLTSTSVGTITEKYTYDVHGNMRGLPHLPIMNWDCSDQLRVTARQTVTSGTPERTWYVYDYTGQRVRQVTDAYAPEGKTPNRKQERISLGGLDLYREFKTDGATVEVDLERETLHIMDGEGRVAMLETRNEGTDNGPLQLIRYQLGNHLGSATLELDSQAQIISYEEYTPYGSTSYQAVRSQTETPKRYRYSGKERDGATGFYYYGMRYYAAWLGRWTSPDPAGTVDGFNLIQFVGGNPMNERDLLGLCREEKRPPFNAKKRRASALEFEIQYGRKPQPRQQNLAAPHRFPEAGSHAILKASEDQKLANIDLEKGFITPLLDASREVRTRLVKNSKADNKKRALAELYKEGEDKVESEFHKYKRAKPNSRDSNELRLALNNLPSNAPSYGPHAGWNTNVSSAIHPNVDNAGNITPRSKAAIAIATYPAFQPFLGPSGRVAMTAQRELPTPSGRAVPMANLSPSTKSLIQSVPQAVRPSLLGGNHPNALPSGNKLW